MLYLARLLGPDYFGKLSFALAFVMPFSIFADFGLSILGIREVARNKGNIIFVAGNMLPVRIFWAMIVFCVLLFVVFFIPKPNDLKLLLLLTGLSLFSSAFLLEWVFQGAESIWTIALSRLCTAFGFALAIFLCVKGVGDILLVPVSQAATGMLTGLILFFILNKRSGTLKIRFSFSCLKSSLLQAFPFGASLVLIQAIYSIDSILLGFMRSDLEVGYYNAAYKIVMVLVLLCTAYFDALFPSLAAAYVSSHETLKKLQDASARLIIIIALPLVFGGTILALPLIELLFGTNYTAAKPILQILIWTVAIVYCSQIFIRGMWACNQQREYIRIVIFQVIVKIISIFILFPKFGANGAAISTVITEIAGFIFYYYMFSKVVVVSFFRLLIRPLISVLVMSSTILFFCKLHCLLLILIGAVVYVCSLYFIKGISKDDFVNIKLIFRKIA